MRKVSVLLSPTLLFAVVIAAALLACVLAKPEQPQTVGFKPAVAQTLEFTQEPTSHDNLVYTRADASADWRQNPAKLYEVTFVSFAIPAVYIAILVAARPLE